MTSIHVRDWHGREGADRDLGLGAQQSEIDVGPPLDLDQEILAANHAAQGLEILTGREKNVTGSAPGSRIKF